MQDIKTYLSPRGIDEAVRAMAAGDVTVFCGGTDLSPQVESGARQYTATLMNIRRVEGMSGIAEAGNLVRIGALTTVTEIRREAAEHFASD